MPLSDHEEQILAEIERKLSEDDPRFVARARKVGGRGHERAALIWAGVGFFAGLVLLFGIIFHQAFGVAGIAVMFLSAVSGLRAIGQFERNDNEDLVVRLRRVFPRR